MVGTWVTTDSFYEFLLFIFFDDGTYLHAEVNPSDSVNGMEWGTFSRDAGDGQTTTTQSFDNNSDAGLTDFSSVGTAPFLFINVSVFINLYHH